MKPKLKTLDRNIGSSRMKTKRYKCISNIEADDVFVLEYISKDYEKNLDEIIADLDRIKKMHYSKNIQLETIQRLTVHEIIKSIIQNHFKEIRQKK